MLLPTDNQRKVNEVIKTGEIAKIRTENGFIEVQVEFEEDVLTPWMPYCLPFVGGTSIFCYPRIGQGGLIVSEGGENNLNRFLPVLDTTDQFKGLSEFDFKILFENGDHIHHQSGNLTISSADTVVVNTENATLNTTTTMVNAENATVNADTITTQGDQVTINAPQIRLNGNVTVAGSFMQTGGATRAVYSASFTAPVTFNAPITANKMIRANADITVNGIALTTHKHDTPAGISEVME